MHALSTTQFLDRSYRNVVFSGGGNRCWWQAGLVERLSHHACWNARRLIGASAGAGIATAFVTGQIRRSLEVAIRRFDATPSNVRWRELLRGKRPFTLPLIYPDWIASFLDANDLARLKRSNLKVDVAITRPASYLPLPLASLLALGLYSSEKFWLKTFHARLPHRLGFRAQYLDLAQSADLDEARNWLLASAAAVPLTPSYRVHGRPALDGGFYDNLPLPEDRAEDPATLVLLTRHRADLPRIFEHDRRVYLQPARPVVAVNMDCTSGANVRATFEQGLSEAHELMS
jgi:predicted acylesterase/phospholipase RssA